MCREIRNLLIGTLLFLGVYSYAGKDGVYKTHPAFKPFGMEITSLDDIPRYCTELVATLAATPRHERWGCEMPVVGKYDDLICQLLHECSLSSPDFSITAFCDGECCDEDTCKSQHFLSMDGDVSNFSKELLLTAYSSKINDLQQGWQYNRRRRDNDYIYMQRQTKIDATEQETRLVSVLMKGFRLGKIVAYSKPNDFLLCLKIPKKDLEKFNRRFRFTLEEIE